MGPILSSGTDLDSSQLAARNNKVLPFAEGFIPPAWGTIVCNNNNFHEQKVLPYWGTAKDRKVIRKYWNPAHLYSKQSPFHVLITNYNLVVRDEKYFHRIKWEYMILDEAQAIKSSSSSRWRSLLQFQCRNRLLLTGTPIQNSMAEVGLY